MAQGRPADDGAQAAQRRADGASTERNRQWPRRPAGEQPDGRERRRDERGREPADQRAWSSAVGRSSDGAAHARDQAARMHDNAASLHDEAVRLGIGDSDEHRRSAERHREAATSHRPTGRRTSDAESAPHSAGQGPPPPDGAA